jgi:hypothetical protein
MKPSDIIDLFNSGEWEKISKLFNNNIMTFLKFSISRGFSNRLDISNIPWNAFEENDNLFDFLAVNGFLDNVDYYSLDDDLKNYYLEWWLNESPDECLKYITNQLLTDVEIRGKGEYWLRLRDREELTVFFDNNGRNSTARDLAKGIFGEDDRWWERFWDTTDNVYRDVIDELDDNNLQVLASRILNEIGNEDLNIEEYGSDFFHELIREQGREDFFQITSDVIYDLIKDEEAMEELLNGDLDELKGELYNIHSNAYNNAYESECYNLVYDGLYEFFSSKITEEITKSGDKTKYTSYIRIENFYGNVSSFVNENKGRGYGDGLLDYHGSYTEMMGSLLDDGVYEKIDFRIPDYPDWDIVNKNINEYFSEYI